MPNWCFNILSIRGRKNEVSRFISEFKPENLKKDGLYVRGDLISTYKQKRRSCRFQYHTRYAPSIDQLLEFLKDYPTVRFKLEYDECLAGFKGVMKTIGAKVRFEKEEDYDLNDTCTRWYYKILRLIRPDKYPRVITLP